MPTVVKATEAHDFLALVPQLAGYQPRDSIVLVGFRGKRTCGVLRFTLPGSGSARVHKKIATTLVGTLCKIDGVDGVIPVVYTDGKFTDPDGLPYTGFVEAIVARSELCGFHVKDALCVAADGWGSYLDDECPASGRPLGSIAESAIFTAVPEWDGRVLGGVADGGELPEVSAETSRSVAAHLERYRGQLADLRGREDWGELWPLTDLPRCFEVALAVSPTTIEDDLAALLILAVQSPPARDVAMLQWAFDLGAGNRVYEESLRFAAGAVAIGMEGPELMWGDGPRPDPERITTATELLRALATRAPESARPPLLCMLAWLTWALGRGSLADTYVREAERIDPHYGLAEVLRGMLTLGHLPEWAFAVPLAD